MRASLSWPRLAVLGLLLAGVILVFQQGWDTQAQQIAAHWYAHQAGMAWARVAYWFGLGGTQVLLMLPLMVWGWRSSQPDRLWAGLCGVAAVAVSGLLVQVFKHLFGRPRPRLDLPAHEIFGPTFQSDLLSFPSGHATTSFALAAALAVWYPRQAWLFYLAAVLVGGGRVVSNSHHLSDVLAGALLGLAVGWALGHMAKARRRASQ